MRPWLTAAAIVLVDQAAKCAVRSSMVPAQSRPLIPHLLHLTYVQNTGMAFGMFRGYPAVFAGLAVVVSAWIVLELLTGTQRDRVTEVALSCVLSGAVGNLIDRARFGYVTDFIDLRVWPVFNIADSAITIGIVLLLWQSLFSRKSQAS